MYRQIRSADEYWVLMKHGGMFHLPGCNPMHRPDLFCVVNDRKASLAKWTDDLLNGRISVKETDVRGMPEQVQVDGSPAMAPKLTRSAREPRYAMGDIGSWVHGSKW